MGTGGVEMDTYERLTSELEKLGWDVRTVEVMNTSEGLYRLVVKKAS